MPSSLGSLVVSLGLDAAEYTRGLTKAQLDAKRASDDMAKVLASAGTAIGAAAGVAALALTAVTKSAIDAADHLLDLSKATGLTVESLGGIGFAAGQAGSDLDGVAGSIGKLNLAIAKAVAGDASAADVFSKLGISLRDAAGATKNADVVFSEVAEKFKGYAEGPEQAALGNALFGKSYQSILPLLKDGGKALQENIDYYRRFGGVTTETARQADEFNDTLGKISLVSGQLGRGLAAELLPPLNAVAQALLDGAENSEAFRNIVAGVKTVFETVAVVGANVAFVLGGVGRELGALAAQAGALARLDLDGFSAISDAVKADGVRARAELDQLERRILGLDPKISNADLAKRGRLPGGGAPQTSAPSLGDGPKPAATPRKTASETQSEAARYLESLQRQADKVLELSAYEQALADIRRGSLTGSAQEVGAVLDKAAQIDASKRLQSQFEAEAAQVRALYEEQDAANKARLESQGRAEAQQVADLQATQRAIAEEGARVFEATRTPVEAYGAEIERLNLLLQEQAVGAETYARAVTVAQERFAEAQKRISDEGSRSTREFAASVESTLGSGLLDVLNGNFNGIEQAFSNMLKRMVAEAAAAQIVKSLMGAGDSGGPNSNPAGFLGSLFAGFFADGGYVPPGKWGWTGERGPEPVFGGRAGVTVVSAQENAAKAGGSSDTTVQNFNVASGVTRNELVSSLQLLAAGLRAEFSQKLRSAGVA